jgi:hypothetical protein
MRTLLLTSWTVRKGDAAAEESEIDGQVPARPARVTADGAAWTVAVMDNVAAQRSAESLGCMSSSSEA